MATEAPESQICDVEDKATFRGHDLSPLSNAKKLSNSSSHHLSPKIALPAMTAHEEALKQSYVEKQLGHVPDTFVLYRIIGNDLEPRHQKGQSLSNLTFILDNEPPLADCEKRWVVNRIVDPAAERQIIDLLEAHEQEYVHIPFVAAEYVKIGWDFRCLPEGFLENNEYMRLGSNRRNGVRAALYRHKNNYVMNNNGARNAALKDGRSRAKWILPWDGNCFVTAAAWAEIRRNITARPHISYYVVPMERVMDNAALLRDDYTPDPTEEPQLVFRSDAQQEFCLDFPYGRRSKVELLWRLGIPGYWSHWPDDPWDLKRPAVSSEAGQFATAGWVARLFSGKAVLEQDILNRALVREEAVIRTLDQVDRSYSAVNNTEDFAFYSERQLGLARLSLAENGETALSQIAHTIVSQAEKELQHKPYSVVDKSTLPPSHDPHDYWHLAPYWWPDPDSDNGLPYIKHDGRRIPGAAMYASGSEKFDRTRVQRMFDGVTTLALAWKLTDRPEFVSHACTLIETWFLDPVTRMNPHLRYAQVRRGWNNNQGSPSGIIEFKDLYYFLDAVRLLEAAPGPTQECLGGLREWLRTYLEWLQNSEQGKQESQAKNNHGVYFDLQTASIAVFLRDQDMLSDVLMQAQMRLVSHFTRDGYQPKEMARTMTQHYCFFNLQGWLHLAQLASANGMPFTAWKREPLVRIVAALDWLAGQDQTHWPHQQIEPFTAERLYPLFLTAIQLGLPGAEQYASGVDFYRVPPVFTPYEGIRPYWNLAWQGLVSIARDSEKTRRPSKPLKHLLILSYGASGTNALVDQLFNNPNIYFHNIKEPLNIQKENKLKAMGSWKDKIQTLIDDAEDKKLLIHVKPEHLEDFNLPLADFIEYCKDHFEFIVVKRKNYLAKRSSSAVKELFKKHREEYVTKKVILDTDELLEELAKQDNINTRMRELVKLYSHIYLEYETHIQKDPKMAADRIAKHFNFYEDYIYERKRKGFDARKNKFSDIKLSDKIGNFEAVKNVLIGTKYEWMLWE